MRCYNGCPDDALQAVLDAAAAIRARILAAGFTVTYFPNGEFFTAFKNYRAVTGECASLATVESELGLVS